MWLKFEAKLDGKLVADRVYSNRILLLIVGNIMTLSKTVELLFENYITYYSLDRLVIEQ
jgi:hypothetical protein